MNKRNPRRLTFALLDKEMGLSELPPSKGEEYPLPEWYRSVREFPLEELDVEDICKACRQQIHSEYVVPLALEILQTEPLAGDAYDGELFVSLKSVSPDYWPKHPNELQIVKSLIEKLLHDETIASDLSQDVEDFLHRVRKIS